MEKEIIEGNKLIAEFMELDVQELNDSLCIGEIDDLKFINFHTDWNDLMMAWEHFRSLCWKNELYTKDFYYHKDSFLEQIFNSNSVRACSKLIAGIEWYKKQLAK